MLFWLWGIGLGRYGAFVVIMEHDKGGDRKSHGESKRSEEYDIGIGHPFSACFRNQVYTRKGHFFLFVFSCIMGLLPSCLLYDCNQNLAS